MQLTKTDILSFIPPHWLATEIDGCLVCQPQPRAEITDADIAVRTAAIEGISLMLSALAIPHRKVGASCLVFHLTDKNNEQTITE